MADADLHPVAVGGKIIAIKNCTITQGRYTVIFVKLTSIANKNPPFSEVLSSRMLVHHQWNISSHKKISSTAVIQSYEDTGYWDSSTSDKIF